MGARRGRRRPETAELGYRLRREAWGQGYATEGSQALLDHAFHTLGLPRVWAVTMAVNTGSRAVMSRLGMRHVRTEVQEELRRIPESVFWGRQITDDRYLVVSRPS